MKKICVVTVSRADYGLLRWVIQEIHESPELELQLVVSGAHYSEDQGTTVNEILTDSFPIAASVPIAPIRTTPVDIIEALGEGLKSLGRVFDGLQPDMLVLLGDRSETMVAAVAATVSGIPIAHIHGGEVTLGAIDDALRHSITKMSLLHFVAKDEYRDRVIQMGENPENVFVVGALGHESILRMDLLTKNEIEEKLLVSFGAHNLLVTVHPETLNPENNDALLRSIVESLRQLPETHVFITASNTDAGGDEFNRVLRELADERENIWFFESLGTLNYLSILSHVDAIVGNSSSGIHEAPFLGIPTINVGNRQLGRAFSPLIASAPSEVGAVLSSILDAQDSKLTKSSDWERKNSTDFHPSVQIVREISRENGESTQPSWPT